MPTVAERILEYLRTRPEGVDDDALTMALGLSRRQHANASCHALEQHGLVERRKMNGKICNFIVEPHECDLFLLSSHHPYTADRALPEFARLGTKNMHGWGIGYYLGGESRCIKSRFPATDHALVSTEYVSAVKTISSPLMLGHLRRTSCGRTREENNHPFQLSFLGYDWQLIHNGSAHNADSLVRCDERLLVDSDSDTPRVFEYLRKHIINYYDSSPRRSLIEACREAYVQLLAQDSGTFNLILSNGQISFAFIHWRKFFLLHREKMTGDVALLSTIRLTEQEEWITFDRAAGKQAKMLVFNGPMLILNGDIPR